MPVTQDRMGRLREFGLSEYAARAYLALLDLGIAEARDVSSLSKVPQAKIYHVLEQLHEKGLVVVLPEFPKKYAPVPFEEYLDRLYEEHRKAASTIETERDDLAELFRVTGDTDVGDRGFFTVLRGRRNVLSKVEEMLAECKRDLLVVGTHGSAERSAKLMPEMRRAHERGVALRFLVPLEPGTLDAFGKVRGVAEVRARELSETEQSGRVAIVVADGRSAFIIHFVPDDGSLANGKDVGVFTDQEAMVAAIHAIVEPHWHRAAAYDDRREQILTGREPPFTRMYAEPAEAWRALDAALSRGVREACALDGQPAASPAPETRELARRQRDAGGAFRAVLNLPDLAAVAAHEAFCAAHPGASVRHLAARLVTRHWILDDREAFFSLSRTGEEGGPDLVVHTNVPSVVRAMRDHFESYWSAALALETRRKELEVFPHLRPGDVGIGLLFQFMGEGVVVAQPDGRVLLWNPAASRIFGREAKDAVGLRLGEILQGDFRVGRVEEKSPEVVFGGEGGERPFEGNALRADGTTRDVEWTLRSVVAPQGGQPFLLAIVRDVTERARPRGAAPS